MDSKLPSTSRPPPGSGGSGGRGGGGGDRGGGGLGGNGGQPTLVYMLATSYAEKREPRASWKSAIAPMKSGSPQLLLPMYMLLRVIVFIVLPFEVAAPLCSAPFMYRLT